MKILIPELENPIVQKAIQGFPEIEFINTENLNDATEILAQDQADSMISGLDYSSRDVLIAYKNHLPLKSDYFSSCFICEKEGQHFALADGGVNKIPTKEQLYTIVEDTAKTYQTYYNEQPKIAMLSYSTNGSGGKNPDLEKIHFVIEKIRTDHSDWLIDGEMQLDAAVSPTISTKKFPVPQAGSINVLSMRSVSCLTRSSMALTSRSAVKTSPCSATRCFDLICWSMGIYHLRILLVTHKTNKNLTTYQRK